MRSDEQIPYRNEDWLRDYPDTDPQRLMAWLKGRIPEYELARRAKQREMKTQGA